MKGVHRIAFPLTFCAILRLSWSKFDEFEYAESFSNCRTSSDPKYARGKKNETCIFPFTVRGVTYNYCTYDYSHVTYGQPWCSTKVDENGNHISRDPITREVNWGICGVEEKCPIPPRDCGVPSRTRPEETFGEDTNVDIEQQPWMVSLGTYGGEYFEWEHQCGGSLITARHVLTAAHCFNNLEIDNKTGAVIGYLMRLGTSDLNDVTAGIERNVQTIYVHPKYKQGNSYYDVGIAVARTHIEFNQYVRPICLPFLPVDDEDDMANIFVTLAGWGLSLTPQNTLVPTSKLKLLSLQVNPTTICERIFSEKNLNLRRVPVFRIRQQLPTGFQKNIACVGNDFAYDQGACDGDSGSPVIRRISDTAKGTPYYEQQFVVSSGLDCKLRATIYVRITARDVLSWIQNVTKTSPLLLVYGGYNKTDHPSPLLDDVELISTTSSTKRLCSKYVRPLSVLRKAEVLFDNLTQVVVSNGGTLGSVGAFVKDAAIICGGKGEIDNFNYCYEYHIPTNRWKIIPSMAYKRYLASSVQDERGNMWVLGGTYNSKGSLSTEVYQYGINGTGRWRRGHPLPEELRDTGISSHCSVRLNKTHVMIAGGFAQAYTFKDPLADLRRSQEQPAFVGSETTDAKFDIRSGLGSGGTDFGRGALEVNISFGIENDSQTIDTTPDGVSAGGYALKTAWMYDGLYWERVANMGEVRDRPACSLVEDPDNGKVQVLVAGGCNGWCVENPATRTAEIFDPDTGDWTRVADIPKPLMSAKMELLGGLPTIVGGYDNVRQNDVLYQYHPSTNEWKPHPFAKLRIARSNPTVFQVPRGAFRGCLD